MELATKESTSKVVNRDKASSHGVMVPITSGTSPTMIFRVKAVTLGVTAVSMKEPG